MYLPLVIYELVVKAVVTNGVSQEHVLFVAVGKDSLQLLDLARLPDEVQVEGDEH